MQKRKTKMILHTNTNQKVADIVVLIANDKI